MPKYTVVIQRAGQAAEEVVATFTKHHTASDFMDEVFKWAGRGVTIGSIYQWTSDALGTQSKTKVK